MDSSPDGKHAGDGVPPTLTDRRPVFDKDLLNYVLWVNGRRLASAFKVDEKETLLIFPAAVEDLQVRTCHGFCVCSRKLLAELIPFFAEMAAC